MKELYDFALRIAERAGEITLRYFGKEFVVESKADQSPVTIADRSAEEFLRAEIERRFPDDGILGEEYGVKEGRSGRRWTIDPIDGTKSFIRGVPLYGTMIALEEGGVSKVGVVRFPATRDTLGAWAGGGCYVNGQRCRVSATASLAEASAMTTDMKNFTERLGRDALMRFVDRTKLQRTWGDCYGYLMVATGRADLMVDPIVQIHDFAPLIPIMAEAGGRFSNLAGETPTEPGAVLATNGLLHEAALAIFRR